MITPEYTDDNKIIGYRVENEIYPHLDRAIKEIKDILYN